MKQAGCTADDWSRIRVGRGFDPKTVADVQFVGDCVLGMIAWMYCLLEGLVRVVVVWLDVWVPRDVLNSISMEQGWNLPSSDPPSSLCVHSCACLCVRQGL